MVIYDQAHPTFWLTDVNPQPVWPLQNVNNLTLCSRPRDWISPMIQQLNWSRHLLSDWWHSQNRSASLHQPDYASVLVSVFLCQRRGDNQRLLERPSRPCCCTAWSCPGQGLPFSLFNSPPPYAVPWAHLFCYSLFNFTQSSSCFSLNRRYTDFLISCPWREYRKWREVLEVYVA